MVISGFVYSKSIENKTLQDTYSFHELFRKFKRYLIPFATVYAVELLIYFVCGIPSVQNLLLKIFHFQFDSNPWNHLAFPSIFVHFLSGGIGPGDYYTPMIIQLILLFPLLYYFIRKYQYKGLIISFISCFVFELIQYVFHIPNSIYRLLVFRHLLPICFGIYLSLGLYQRNKVLNMLSLLIGFIYILAVNYHDMIPSFFNRSWSDVNFMSCLFYLPIIAFILSKQITFKPLEQIGKASYHIYLIQMLYYNFVKKSILIKFLKNQFLWCTLSLLICVLIGFAFYKTENRLLKKLKKLII